MILQPVRRTKLSFIVIRKFCSRGIYTPRIAFVTRRTPPRGLATCTIPLLELGTWDAAGIYPRLRGCLLGSLPTSSYFRRHASSVQRPDPSNPHQLCTSSRFYFLVLSSSSRRRPHSRLQLSVNRAALPPPKFEPWPMAMSALAPACNIDLQRVLFGPWDLISVR